MKDFKEFIKSLWHDKRKRAFVSLALWIIFFVIVFIMIGGPNQLPREYLDSSKPTNKSGSAIDNFKAMENYEYNYEIKITDSNNITNTYEIDGIYYDVKYYFEMNNRNYYILDNELYDVDKDSKTLTTLNKSDSTNILNMLDIRLFNKDSMYTLINSSEEQNSTTYKDGSMVRNLTYKSYDNHIIDMVVTEYSNIISSIELDLSKYLDQPSRQVEVEVNLENINNIAEYDLSYDDYKIIKEGEIND